MKKYAYLFSANISMLTAYRFELFWSWIYRIFELGVYFFLWRFTAQTPEEEARLLVYFVLYYLIFKSSSTGRIADWMDKEINQGEVNMYLIKPISYPITLVARLVTRVISKTLAGILIIVGLVLFFPEIFAPSSFANLIFFILFTIIGLFLWNLFTLIIGSIAFWGTRVGNLLSIVDLILYILKGAFVPAFYFPLWLTSTLELTPIHYLATFPIELYQTQVPASEIITAFFICIIWLIILFFVFQYIYTRGLKRYDALGA